MTLALGLASGGLDSLLAIRLVQRMGLDVLALHFVVGFEAKQLHHEVENQNATLQAPDAIHQTGATVEVIDLRHSFFQILSHPPHGYGANLNPCVDCKILMLKRARELMDERKAVFVFTGEVIGQRPMSQRKDMLELISKESGLMDRLVRPLSGRLLAPTAPEREGIIRREQLESIHGRSRARQLELATALRIDEFPTPAGGCLLTDPNYASRARDLMGRREGGVFRIEDPLLLLVGRHVVLPHGSKAIIGRNQVENAVIERFGELGQLLRAEEAPGPTTLLENPCHPQDVQAAAQLTARYGKGRSLPEVTVLRESSGGQVDHLTVTPIVPEPCRFL
jgi:tRNA-uridine 2-sulfurtransferase